jgi:hypothetical protein
MKKILIISELHIIKTFILPTISKLKQGAEVQFDCLIVTKINQSNVNELSSIFTNIYFNKYPTGFISRIPKLRFFQYMYGLIKLARGLSNYDIAHVNYHHYYYAFFTPIIRKKVKHFYITFYGSDFNEIVWYKHIGNKKSITLSDKIFVSENPKFLKQIVIKYNIQNAARNTGILFPLMRSFELFENYLMNSTIENAKSVFGINSKRLIVCGYNAAPIVRHKEIIKTLVKIEKNLTDYVVIFPMTYGQMANITRPEVKTLLKATNLNYQVLEDYLSIEKLLALRLASDIFIHIQTRDQLASSMLEHLAAGSVVITGKWLPYESLKEMGVYFIQIEKIEDLEVALLEVIENFGTHLELCKKNRSIILNLTSWEKNKWSWYKDYDLILK